MQNITSPSFAAALPFILRWEGGFVDDPDDRGGRTNKGVTQAVYQAWRADQGLPGQDVRQINDQEVASIWIVLVLGSSVFSERRDHRP
jgi:lysozyme family protein